MPHTARKLSEVMQEMAKRLLRRPDAIPSTEAAHVSLMFANVAWNETVGLGGAREGIRPAWECIEAGNPEMWSEFRSNDVNAMIDELVQYKNEHYPSDQRRILTCGIPNGNVRVEWLAPAAPGVDSQWEMTLYGLVRTNAREQAIQFLRRTCRMSRREAAGRVAEIASEFELC